MSFCCVQQSAFIKKKLRRRSAYRNTHSYQLRFEYSNSVISGETDSIVASPICGEGTGIACRRYVRRFARNIIWNHGYTGNMTGFDYSTIRYGSENFQLITRARGYQRSKHVFLLFWVGVGGRRSRTNEKYRLNWIRIWLAEFSCRRNAFRWRIQTYLPILQWEFAVFTCQWLRSGYGTLSAFQLVEVFVRNQCETR